MIIKQELFRKEILTVSLIAWLFTNLGAATTVTNSTDAPAAQVSKIHPALAAKIHADEQAGIGKTRVIIWLKIDANQLPSPPIEEKYKPEGEVQLQSSDERQQRFAEIEQEQITRQAQISQLVSNTTTDFLDYLRSHGIQADDISSVTPSVVATLSHTDVNVVSQYPDVVRILPDPEQSLEMTVMLPAVAADTVWPSYDGTGSRIAIVEGDGIATNPHLGSFTARPGTYGISSHKTKVAGCARSQNTDHRGAAPGATLYDARASRMTWSSLKAAADWAVSQNVHIISNSWGSNHGGEWQDDDVYYDWLSYYNRITITKSAGNEGMGNGYVTNPGCAYNVITVGNVDPGGGSSFSMDDSSSYVDPESGGEKPEIAAPGEAEAYASPEWHGLLTASPWYGNASAGGTSFASPIVAGICGLIIDDTPSFSNEPEVLKAMIMVGGLHRNIEGASQLSEFDGAGMATARCVYAGGYTTTITSASFNGSGEYELSPDIPLTAGDKKRIVLVYGHQPQVQDPLFPDPVGGYDRCDIDLRLYVNGSQVASSTYGLQNAFEIIDYTPTQSGTGKIRLYKYSWDADISSLRIGTAWASQSTVIRPIRSCSDCEPEDSSLGTIGTTIWGYSVSGNCGNGGKWVGKFTGEAGSTYHFDLCPDSPGNGTNSGFDPDIKITNNSCTILAGEDGSCSSPSYSPNNFTWTCPSNGTYYIIIAPYNSYSSHTCGGYSSDTFTLQYYKEVLSDCMAETNPGYDNWIYWNKPDCWCYPRQCRGDVDGLKFANVFWVSGQDLNMLKRAINKSEVEMPADGECADLDHMKFANIFWVSGQDLNIMKQYINRPESEVPECGNPPDSNYNFWVIP